MKKWKKNKDNFLKTKCVQWWLQIQFYFTIEPNISRHPQNQNWCLLRRGVCLLEVKNIEFVRRRDWKLLSTYVWCLLMEGLHWWEFNCISYLNYQLMKSYSMADIYTWTTGKMLIKSSPWIWWGSKRWGHFIRGKTATIFSVKALYKNNTYNKII